MRATCIDGYESRNDAENLETLTDDIVPGECSGTEDHRRLDVRGAGGCELVACASHEAEPVPLFSIQLRNSAYYARDDAAEHDSAEAALAAGVHSAMRMLTDEIVGGCRNAAIDVVIERDDGTRLLNSVVAISVSSLIVADRLVIEDA